MGFVWYKPFIRKGVRYIVGFICLYQVLEEKSFYFAIFKKSDDTDSLFILFVFGRF